ncbi:LacI family DNA-binding transcriptional regulator [Nostocoides sp. HKS02]|uniref:LacI family DNA-binding transcriptional regulator n=1 Tax=Nostocoides sp. HKS02 TaxID=1813880 RepID=UPI0012B48B72|nr:substrate-binding domain-containing protein [Tetrasphaera sp. HKS02]QGN57824.1 LacI family DNA-binding transcriptional regulator [Tetrasphaera sp. HKS02]
MGNVTLKSVAEAAGVSISTVSNAYNKPEQMSAEVRQRVLDTAKALGYAGPNAAARSLRSQRAGAIGLLFTEQLSYAFSDPYSVGMLAGLSEVAEEHRTGLLLIPLPPADTGRPEDVELASDTMRQAVVDGVVAYCVDPDHPARQVALDRGLPMASTTELDDERQTYVLIDEDGAAKALGRHLRDLGHRDVGIVVNSRQPTGPATLVGPEDEAELYNDSRLRLRGLREALGGQARVTAVSAGHNSHEAGLAAAAYLLDRHDRPTAIACTSDVLALGVLDGIRQRGLQVGRDVSLSGFDDIAEAQAAGLTTVRQPIAEKGRLLGRMLLDPAFTQRRVVLDTELVIRSSTGPATGQPSGPTPNPTPNPQPTAPPPERRRT